MCFELEELVPTVEMSGTLLGSELEVFDGPPLGESILFLRIPIPPSRQGLTMLLNVGEYSSEARPQRSHGDRL